MGKWHSSPFSTDPINGLEKKGKHLIALTKQEALLWFIPGLAMGYATGLHNASFHFQFYHALLISLTLITSFLFGYKQWSYYFGEGNGKKDGIFCKTIGIVNNCEKTTDVILSFMGGWLAGTFLFPPLWFSVLCLYELAVVVRSLLPLMRDKFRKEGFPVQYRSMKNIEHGSLKVGSSPNRVGDCKLYFISA